MSLVVGVEERRQVDGKVKSSCPPKTGSRVVLVGGDRAIPMEACRDDRGGGGLGWRRGRPAIGNEYDHRPADAIGSLRRECGQCCMRWCDIRCVSR